MTVETIVNFRRESRSTGDTYLLGTTYWDSQSERDEDPLQTIENASSISQLKHILNSLTGFFAITTTISDSLILITDCIQGIPLYYYRTGETIYISDSEERIRPILEIEDRDPVSVSEYRTVTYVTGPHTILKNLYQVEAGTMVIFSKNEKNIQRYYNYRYNGQREISHQDIDNILDVIISRLIEYADGRPIWVPLSAGYDSRLLMTALVERDYEELYAFSYGLKNNYEAKKSEKVAESLGVPWYFVQYNREKWIDWYGSEDRKEIDAAMELTTVPPLREWPAVRELFKNGDMTGQSVIVPGHSADFLAGSHIPTNWVNKNQVSSDEYLDRIISEHYQYNSMNETEKINVKKRIKEVVDFNGGLGIEAIEAYERWDWQARQSRQITAHVWPHELTGVDWWMPYWDREFIDFWLQVPLNQRLNRRFYNNYVWSKYKQNVDEPILPEGFEDNWWGNIKYHIKRSQLGPFATNVYNSALHNNSNKKQSSKDAYEHPIGNMMMMDYETFAELYNGDRNARSYRSRERLGEICFQ